jgi:carbon-monoxide dehydrogenase medium subunit
MRLARPTLLVDINGLSLDRIDVEGEELRLGALVRHRQLERDRVVAKFAPLLARAARHIGHVAIRHRGTLGGSLAHADPVAELPAALVALDGSVIAEGPEGRRIVRAVDLFDGFLTTTLSPDELIIEVRVPVLGPSSGVAFREWAPRSGDFALAGVAVVVARDGTIITSVRAAACGVSSRPLDISPALQRIVGGPVTSAALADVEASVRDACAGDEDVAELAGLLAAQAVAEATA